MGEVWYVNSADEMCDLMCGGDNSVREFKSFYKEVKGNSVCEDEDVAYTFWQKHNPNPNDCCNLKHGRYDTETHMKPIAKVDNHRRLI